MPPPLTTWRVPPAAEEAGRIDTYGIASSREAERAAADDDLPDLETLYLGGLDGE